MNTVVLTNLKKCIREGNILPFIKAVEIIIMIIIIIIIVMIIITIMIIILTMMIIIANKKYINK